MVLMKNDKKKKIFQIKQANVYCLKKGRTEDKIEDLSNILQF